MWLYIFASCATTVPAPSTPVVDVPQPPPTALVAPAPTVPPTDPCAGRILPVKPESPPFDAATLAAHKLDQLLGLACTLEESDPLLASQFVHEAVSRPDAPTAAHFLLARTLTRLRVDHGPICDNGAFASVILDHLALASVEPGYAAAAQNPMFAEFRNNVRYRVATGRPVKGPGALKALVEGIDIYAPPAGVYGSQEKLTLAPDAVLKREVLAFDENGMPMRVKSEKPKGWSVDGDALVIDAGDGPVRVLLTPFDLQFATPGGDVRWIDADSECEA